MNQEVKNRWIEALRSGEYKQGMAKLRTIDDRFCCLGVLCDISNISTWINNGIFHSYAYGGLAFEILPIIVGEWADLDEGSQQILMRLNDSGKSFIEIADYIEKNL